jgi:hypothetical protein
MKGKQITSVDDALRFVTAGRASFTLVSNITGDRFTYRLRRPKDSQPTGGVPKLFLDVMLGSDNERLLYTGWVSDARPGRFYIGRRYRDPRYLTPKHALAVKAFRWFWAILHCQLRLPGNIQLCTLSR